MEQDKMTPLEDTLENPQPTYPEFPEKPPLPPEAMLTPPPREIGRGTDMPAMPPAGQQPEQSAPFNQGDQFRQPPDSVQPPVQPPSAGPTPPVSPVTYASDYERMMALPPIPKQEAESYRHSHEKRWYRRLVVLNILLIISALFMLVKHLDHVVYEAEDFSAHFFAAADDDSDSDADDGKTEKEKYLEEREQKRENAEYMENFRKYMPTGMKWVFGGIAAVISLFIAMYLNFASLKASSLKITQRNFPEVYSLLYSFAYRLGMEKVPEMYIMQQSGVLNAFSSFIFGRQYILMNTEVFEVAYREHKDLNALAFVMAHELSHIYYGHSTLHYHLAMLFSEGLPVIGQIASRTREYSCDRLAQRLTNYDGVQAIIMLIVDRHLYPMVDVQDYVDTTIQERGFWMWIVNLLASHPIMPKRIRALIQWTGSGELY